MIIDIGPKFFSALFPPYNLEVKVTDFRNFMLKFYLKVLKILYFLSKFSNHTIHLVYIWYTDSYGRCSATKINLRSLCALFFVIISSAVFEENDEVLS